jgi:hypothetical protein
MYINLLSFLFSLSVFYDEDETVDTTASKKDEQLTVIRK